ncbi:hypothetical protein C4F51_03830 [Cellvibrio sp. KB43]|uniref:Uncharacterized protein n=1 Tax=Cellvibrio polysaccharolyticus TaxID=2082724 RepID=A0A928V562_9GAMM|nr:hypothetical protein [Cellvibrio polysaccharolyticus]
MKKFVRAHYSDSFYFTNLIANRHANIAIFHVEKENPDCKSNRGLGEVCNPLRQSVANPVT